MAAVPLPVSAYRPRLFGRLANVVLAPEAFDFWASRLHPTWSWSRPLARIVERRAESRDTCTLVLQPNRH